MLCPGGVRGANRRVRRRGAACCAHLECVVRTAGCEVGALLAAPMWGPGCETLGSRQDSLGPSSLGSDLQKAPVAMHCAM